MRRRAGLIRSLSSCRRAAMLPQFVESRNDRSIAEGNRQNFRFETRSSGVFGCGDGPLGSQLESWQRVRDRDRHLDLTAFRASPTLSLVQFDVELKARGAVGSEVGTDVISFPGRHSAGICLAWSGWRYAFERTPAWIKSQVTELPGTESARGPFFSPDGGWVGFEAAGKLKKTPVAGGLPVVLCDSTNLLGASWGEDGNITASLGGKALSRISASGGRQRSSWICREIRHAGMAASFARTKLILFTTAIVSRSESRHHRSVLAPNRQTKILARGGTYGRYLPTGILRM